MPNLRSNRRSAHRMLRRVAGAELGRPKARLGNPNTGIPEIVVWLLYDIYFAAVATALAKLTLFAVPAGQQYNSMGVTAFNKGDGHTNIVQPGMLESSFSFVVRALSFYVQALQGSAHPILHPEDLLNLLSCYYTFRVNKKSYLQGILGWLPAGGGAMMGGFGTLTAAASAQVSTNGLPLAHNLYTIPGGVVINPQEQFDTIIDPTQNTGGAPSTLAAAGNPAGVTAAGISAWFKLDGTLIRVAQ